MSQDISSPYLNPVQLIKLTPDEVPQYQSKHMDEWYHLLTIPPWMQSRQYFQTFLQVDSLRLQFISNYGPLTAKLLDPEGFVKATQPLQQMQQRFYQPGTFIYQLDWALNVIPTGYYQLKIECGNPTVQELISEPIFITDKAPHTLLFEYKHRKEYCDVIFQNGFSPSIRLPATLKLRPPASKDTIYPDQRLNYTMLDSKPYEVWELRIGGAAGVPDYLVRKIIRILGCSDLLIDGKYYTKADGAKLDELAQDGWARRGWSIELVEKLSRHSKHYSDDVAISGVIAAVANVDSKGFISDDSGGSVHQIRNVD